MRCLILIRTFTKSLISSLLNRKEPGFILGQKAACFIGGTPPTAARLAAATAAATAAHVSAQLGIRE